MNYDDDTSSVPSVMGKQLTENGNTSVWKDLNKSEDCAYRTVSFNIEKWKILFHGQNYSVQTGK